MYSFRHADEIVISRSSIGQCAQRLMICVMDAIRGFLVTKRVTFRRTIILATGGYVMKFRIFLGGLALEPLTK